MTAPLRLVWPAWELCGSSSLTPIAILESIYVSVCFIQDMLNVRVSVVLGSGDENITSDDITVYTSIGMEEEGADRIMGNSEPDQQSAMESHVCREDCSTGERPVPVLAGHVDIKYKQQQCEGAVHFLSNWLAIHFLIFVNYCTKEISTSICKELRNLQYLEADMYICALLYNIVCALRFLGKRFDLNQVSILPKLSVPDVKEMMQYSDIIVVTITWFSTFLAIPIYIVSIL